MQFLNLDIIKAHLNIAPDFNGDDYLLISYADASEQAIQAMLDTKLTNMLDENGNLPDPIISAMLLLVGTLFNDRENDVHGTITKHSSGVEYLIAPFRNYGQLEHLRFNNERRYR